MKTCLLVGLTAALLLAACKKDNPDPDGLVVATQEGKNTGDFLLNGSPYGPGRSSAYPGKAVSAFWSKIRGARQVTIVLGRIYDKDQTVLNIVLTPITRPSVFNIADGVSPVIVSGNKSYIAYEITHPGQARYFLTSPTALGRVEVTRYDTVAHVISGTFVAKLREYQGPDSLVITKGRFDCTF